MIIRTYGYGPEDILTLVETVDGKHVCPICGFVMDGPTYEPRPPLPGHTLPQAGATYGICPSCRVEYRNDDIPDHANNETKADVWHAIRLSWLDTVSFADDAIQQLGNLGFTAAEVERWRE